MEDETPINTNVEIKPKTLAEWSREAVGTCAVIGGTYSVFTVVLVFGNGVHSLLYRE